MSLPRDRLRHNGPSVLDHRTLANSGPLPLAFLRGCGLPEALIEYLPSLLGETIQFYSCFISYSSADEDFCRRLHARLQDAGLRVWFAPHNIHGGQKIHEQIDDAIRVYCSGRQGLNLAGESPVIPIARFGYVAIPQFVEGNHTSIAWCKRPGCPMACGAIEVGATWRPSKYGSLNIRE